MPQLEKADSVENVLNDYEFHYENLEAIYEIGLYESRYPGKVVDQTYDLLHNRLVKVLELYPAKADVYERAMVGFELFSQRRGGSRKL